MYVCIILVYLLTNYFTEFHQQLINTHTSLLWAYLLFNNIRVYYVFRVTLTIGEI